MTKIHNADRAADAVERKTEGGGVGEVQQDEAGRFKKALRGKDAGAERGGQDKESREPLRPGGPQAGLQAVLPVGAEGAAQGHALLRGLELQRGATAGAEAAKPGSSVGEIAQAVADRILVSEKSGAGEQDVRIFLKDSVLAGTEIRIRTSGDQLQVAFLAGNADTQAFLESRQKDLTTELGQRLNRSVEVTVTPRDEPDQGGGDGRSRNRQDYEPEEDA